MKKLLLIFAICTFFVSCTTISDSDFFVGKGYMVRHGNDLGFFVEERWGFTETHVVIVNVRRGQDALAAYSIEKNVLTLRFDDRTVRYTIKTYGSKSVLLQPVSNVYETYKYVRMDLLTQ